VKIAVGIIGGVGKRKVETRCCDVEVERGRRVGDLESWLWVEGGVDFHVEVETIDRS